jgi:hypothetical protein
MVEGGGSVEDVQERYFDRCSYLDLEDISKRRYSQQHSTHKTVLPTIIYSRLLSFSCSHFDSSPCALLLYLVA